MRFFRQVWRAFYCLFNDGGFTMAGAMAFSFVLAIFPFFIFVGALAGYMGGPELARVATDQVFQLLPKEIARYLVPQIDSVLGQARYDLLTVGGLVTLFFASNGIESLRWALNTSYRDDEQRSFVWQRFQSVLLVFMAALVMIFLAYSVVIAPLIAENFGARLGKLLPAFLTSEWPRIFTAFAVLVAQLYVFHAWLPAGRRRFAELWPGIALTVVLWALIAFGFSYYLNFSSYTEIYAGLSQIIISLVFFYISSAIIIFGAEFNHARMADKNGYGAAV